MWWCIATQDTSRSCICFQNARYEYKLRVVSVIFQFDCDGNKVVCGEGRILAHEILQPVGREHWDHALGPSEGMGKITFTAAFPLPAPIFQETLSIPLFQIFVTGTPSSFLPLNLVAQQPASHSVIHVLTRHGAESAALAIMRLGFGTALTLWKLRAGRYSTVFVPV